jgi:predicted nucleic acid-binding protein
MVVNETKEVRVPIPSDALRHLLRLRNEVPALRPSLDDIVQIVVVLDASAVQRELRWRLRSRTNLHARTRLHEAIDSGVVIAVAPTFLRQEIEKYLPAIASDAGVSVDVAAAEWQRVQSLIRFHEPNGDGARFTSVDPKDADYMLIAQELEADFVRTCDPHFLQMGANVMGPEFESVLRDYARSTSVLVTVKLGSTVALTFSIEAFAEAIRGLTEMIGKLSPAVKVLLTAAVAIALLHPTLRAKVVQCLKMAWGRLRESKPILVSISQEVLKHALISKTSSEAIKSRLPLRKKQTALSHARLICLRASEPLTADEIAQRILANGYCSRSKTFTAYVRRLLREDQRFVATADGLWMLRTSSVTTFLPA